MKRFIVFRNYLNSDTDDVVMYEHEKQVIDSISYDYRIERVVSVGLSGPLQEYKVVFEDGILQLRAI